MRRILRLFCYSVLVVLSILFFYTTLLFGSHEERFLDPSETDAEGVAEHETESAFLPNNTAMPIPPVQLEDTPFTSYPRTNACIVILARESDLEGVSNSIKELEARFNYRYAYPYVLLNENEFSDKFQTSLKSLTESTVEFGVIPTDHWHQPDWIDEDRAKKARDRLKKKGVKYGAIATCVASTLGHELLQKYRWYWRVEPNVHFHCDVAFDPFKYMEDNDKVYAFTITVYEIYDTIPSLWSHVTEFVKQHPEYISPDNSMDFISRNNGYTYNLCHFWSNFEIADMDFWRGPAYAAFFKHLDSTGGFYYERWGDAPVHSIAASLFARKDQVHFFNEIGYQHDDWSHCPPVKDVWEKANCVCDRNRNFDYDDSSCMKHWDALWN